MQKSVSINGPKTTSPLPNLRAASLKSKVDALSR